MKEEGCIALFSLIEGPYNINDEIKIDGVNRNIPTTGCIEIDKVLQDTLATETYFHARLQFNKDCLALSIIGGSWEGRRFSEKIKIGFKLYQKIDATLKLKYPVSDWNKWKVSWHYAGQSFYLEPKEIT